MDIDIDVKDRKEILADLHHVRALASNKISPHNVGIYVQDIPYNPKTSTAQLSFTEAEELGFFKFDILNNSIYEGVNSEAHLEKLMVEPPWGLLEYEDIVGQLAHVHNHYDIVSTMKPQSIEQLAMVIAMIRPAKRYLVGRSWEYIEAEIWTKPTDDSYYFKKSHSIAYSMSIVVQLNLLIEKSDENI